MLFFYIPFGTNALICRTPVITMAMIAINVLVWAILAFGMFTQEQMEPFMLTRGDGLKPWQWLTSMFIHVGFVHLLFNMFFLWTFGPVIEEKLGEWKMVALYLGIGIFQCAVEQILFLGTESPPSFGTSPIIFGLLAMCFIWAPENKVRAFFFYWFIIRINWHEIETDVCIIAGFFVLLDVVLSLFLFGSIFTPLMHFTGAIIGLVIAIILLKMKRVDCDYQDIFSAYSGAKDKAEEEEKESALQKMKEARHKRDCLLTEEIELALANQTPLPAFIIAQRKEVEFTEWTLPRESHFTMIQQLLAGEHYEEATASIRQYLQRHLEQAVFVQMMLAQALLAQNKPKAASKVLDDIASQELGVQQQSAIQKIQAKAEAMYRKNVEAGIYEVVE